VTNVELLSHLEPFGAAGLAVGLCWLLFQREKKPNGGSSLMDKMEECGKEDRRRIHERVNEIDKRLAKIEGKLESLV